MAAIEFGKGELSIADVWRIANRDAELTLSKEALKRVQRSAEHVENALKNKVMIYGVTTGYGDSVTSSVNGGLVEELPLHLTRFHGCGLGRFLTPVETRAVMAVRLCALLRGWSGVSVDLATLLFDMLRLDILPLVPSEGSVGASGDLTPLSYLAGALAGERDVMLNGRRMSSAAAFAETGLKPIKLRPKEALAMMNGTAVMTGLAVLAYVRAEGLARLSSRLTAMAAVALLGNPVHFDPRLSQAKPHPGQGRVAARIAADLAAFHAGHTAMRLQDRYSIRCAPHVVGVLEDMLPTFRAQIETEINSANDNPLFDPETGDVLSGGHFYGGHIAFVMDSLKNLAANLADLMDRQFALLVDARFNNGLPVNLSGATGARAPINHGLKAVQIAVSAWTAEALKLTMPASVFSRSTECHNQDKVSMGTIAARDAIRVLELTEQVAAAHVIACGQALKLRLRAGEVKQNVLGPGIAALMEAAPFIDEDAPLDKHLAELTGRIAAREWRFDWPGDAES
ncbi:MAG TPA: aromatic amino acid ammonia-lyase [Caulobacterales bacterium]|nr:aromatic amino acid ammonia-lyase [Caulobacterales bacterium]